MNKNVIVCPKCGKEHKITLKEVSEHYQCGHCNKKMCFDEKTVRKLKYIRYVFVFAICAILMFALQDLEKVSSYVLLGVVIIAATFISAVADKLCVKLLYLTFGCTYMEYVEKPKTKNVVKKKTDEKKKGFSLFGKKK